MNMYADYSGAVGQVRSMFDENSLALADRVQFMQDRYFGLPRDELLAFSARFLLNSVAAQRGGDRVHIPGKKRIITLTGESNSGKSRALIEHFVRAKELQTYIDENGNEITPVLIFEMPSPCLPKLIAIRGLQALGVPVRATIGEGEAWDAFRKALKAHKIMVVCIDEAQHAIDHANVLEKVKIANAFKSMVQMPDWPVRLVLAGVPTLADYMAEYRQLRSRNYPIHFDPLTLSEGIAILTDKLPKVIVEHAGLQMSPELSTPDFVPRLLHANLSEFGGSVQMIRDAVEITMLDGNEIVTKGDFETAYRMASGCRPHENVFTADDWSAIDVPKASIREKPEVAEELPRKTRRSKELTFGERP